MIKKMLIKGGVLIAGLIATEAVIEKLERAWLKNDKTKELESKKEIKITEGELAQAFEEAHKMADELEAKKAK
jgi:hypothetical protein